MSFHKMRKQFNGSRDVKPISNTQAKKLKQIIYENIRKSESYSVLPRFTCCVCNLDLRGSCNLMKHLAPHNIQDWDWMYTYEGKTENIPDTHGVSISLYSSGLIKCLQSRGSIINDIYL